MGSEASSAQKPDNQQLMNGWETIDHFQDWNIVRNSKTAAIGQSRKFKLNPAYHPKKEIQIYKMRQQTHQPIVSVYGAQLLQKPSRKKGRAEQPVPICGSNNYLGVICERIPFTLANLPQITFNESLLVLRQSLKGYQYLFARVGPIHVNQHKIATNDQGQVKVWISHEWHLNHPMDEIHSLESTRNQKINRQYNLIAPQYRDQKEMVENIIDVVQDKCQQGRFPPEFGALIREQGHSFASARQFLQQYTKRLSHYIPPTLKLHKILIEKPPKDEFSKNYNQGKGKVGIKQFLPLGSGQSDPSTVFVGFGRTQVDQQSHNTIENPFYSSTKKQPERGFNFVGQGL